MQKKEIRPSVLKSTFRVAAFMLVFTLGACSLDSESNYTPEIVQSAFFTNQKGDTLKLRYVNSEYVLDTIRVGDTVSMRYIFNAFTNQLKTFHLKQSADSVSRIVLPAKLSLDSLFTSASDYQKGQFYFRPSIHAINFPFKYVATKTTMTAKFNMTLTSDAKFGNTMGTSNVRTVEIKTPTKPAIILE